MAPKWHGQTKRQYLADIGAELVDLGERIRRVAFSQPVEVDPSPVGLLALHREGLETVGCLSDLRDVVRGAEILAADRAKAAVTEATPAPPAPPAKQRLRVRVMSSLQPEFAEDCEHCGQMVRLRQRYVRVPKHFTLRPHGNGTIEVPQIMHETCYKEQS
jgi:hypothetical protein